MWDTSLSIILDIGKITSMNKKTVLTRMQNPHLHFFVPRDTDL